MKNAPHGRTIPWFLIYVFLFLVLCILTTGYILYQTQQERLKSEAENYLAAIGDLKVNQIIQWRSERIADGWFFLNNPPLIKTVEELLKSPDNKTRKQELLKVMESFKMNSVYESCILLNSKGKVQLAHSEYGDSLGGQAMFLFYEAVKKREIILSDFHQSGPFPFVHIDLMIPLFSQSRYDSSLLGAFMLRIDPRVMLFKLIETWPTPSRTSETVLIRQEGDSITYINEVRHKKNTPSTLRMPVSRTQLPAVMAVQGREGVVEGIDYRGVPVLAAVRHVQDSPWYIIAKIDQDEIYEPLYSLAWNVIIVILLLILIAAGFVGLWWRNQRAKFYRERYTQEMERQALIKHFDHIIKYANDSILLVDMNGKIIEANDQACRMYGYSRSEILRLNINEIRSQKNSLHDEGELKQVEERGGLVYEAEHLRKDGTVFPVEVSSRFIKIEEKRFYQSIIRDITERKKNEKMLQSAKEYAENLIQTANTIVIGLSLEGNVTIFNRAAEELTGYTKSELENRSWFEVLVPKDRYPEVWEEFNRLIKGGMPKHFENPILTKDGKERYIIWSNSNIYEKDRIIGTVSYGLDITERKQSIEVIRKSEQRFKNLSDLLPQTVFETDEKGNLTFVNRQGFKTYGYPEDFDLNNLNIMQTIAPQDRDRAIKNIQRRFKGEEIGLQEYLAVKKDGSTFSVILYVNRILQDDKPAGLSGIVIDITDRKQAEEALRLSEERFRRLVESVTDYIYSVKLESGHPVYTTHAPACVSVTGYTTEEYAGDPNLWFRMIYEDDKMLVEELTKKILSGHDVLPLEHRIVHKNGSIRWIKNTPVLKRDSKGSLIAYDGLIEDVTMQKLADEALRESEETANALLNSTKEAAYLIDTDQRIIAVNEAGAQRFGKSIVELVGLCIADLLPAELAALRNAIFKKIIETGKPIHFQDVQSGMHLENSGYPITDAQGKVIRIAFYSKDITERIKSEEAMRHERNLLRTLIDNLPDGIYVKDRQCRKTIANPADVRNSGRKSESEVIGKDDFDLFSKEMAAGFFADDQSVMETGKPVINREEYVLDAEGKKRWLLTSKLPLHNEKGTITGLIGIGRDITDRILIEKELRQSESLFKMLVESSPVAIAVFAGQTKKLEYVSGRFAELFGYKKEDIPTMDAWWQHAYPIEEYRQQIEIKWIENFVNAQQKNGITEPLESIITCKDGSTKYIESTSTSVGNDTLVFFTDLTQHRQAQEALRQTHAFNELLMQTMPFGMDIVDEDGRILFMSKAMKDMLKADAVNSCCWIAYKDNKQQCPNCPLREGINFGKPDTIEVEGIFNDRTFQISHVGMMYEGRKAILEVFQDITEQKNLQQDLMQSQKLLSIGTMAGGIAHDFNNILAIILGYSSLLLSIKDNPQKFSDGVTAIRQAVDRGAALVRQILTFARKTDISFEMLNVTELVKELVSMLQQTFPKIITFKTTIEEHLPHIKADYTQIHQALLNLCVNARDAISQGGEIVIAVRKITGDILRSQFNSALDSFYLSVSVSDNGAGMDESVRSRIFDPFFTTKEKGKGTGLGLSVVYGIVQAHQGFVNVESSPKQGTTFTLYFPVPEEGSQSLELQEQSEEQVSGGNETLLLVEDEVLLLDMVQILLETNGYTVLTAKDGEEAVQIYQQHAGEISLVISDMGLPKLSGMSEFEKLKEINPDVKIVFASGFFEPDVKATLEKAGVRIFIQKPYVIEEVLLKIRKALDAK